MSARSQLTATNERVQYNAEQDPWNRTWYEPYAHPTQDSVIAALKRFNEDANVQEIAVRVSPRGHYACMLRTSGNTVALGQVLIDAYNWQWMERQIQISPAVAAEFPEIEIATGSVMQSLPMRLRDHITRKQGALLTATAEEIFIQ